MDDGAGAQAPMDVIETSRKRSADDAGHETDDADRGGVQPDPGSMAADMQEARRDAETLGADAVALAEAYSPARFQRRAGTLCLRVGVVMDLCLGWDLGLKADQVKAQKRLGVEKPHALGLIPVAGTQHKARENGRAAEGGQASLGVCLQFSASAGRARWTRSL